MPTTVDVLLPYHPGVSEYRVVDISDDASDPSIEELQVYKSGVPLTRMVDLEYMSSSSVQDSDGGFECADHAVRDEDINYIEEDMSYFDLTLNGGDGEGPEADFLPRSPRHTHVHDIIDHFATSHQQSSMPQLLLHAVPSQPHHTVMLRHLPSTSTSARELMLWRYLNDPEIRRDPWNPSPPALMIIERELSSSLADRLAHIIEYGGYFDGDQREDEAFIAMDPLHDLQENPLQSTADWVDFIRQMIQSLVFLHEHNIAQAVIPRSIEDLAQSIKMDIGLAPPNAHFSRIEFPVKYYFLDFSKAIKLRYTDGGPTRAVTASRETGCVIGGIHTARLGIPHCILDMDPEKQSHPLSGVALLGDLSDPEEDSSTDEISSSEDEERVRIVSETTRAMIFATDLKNLAHLFENAMTPAAPLTVALAPVFSAMTYSKAGSFRAADALEAFERAVRGLDFL
ncbi:hypothetical protein BU17DRAFT_71141 [Hysterangium stoloniferum]|nr:hypothetical protein BU17DRAFT_71141 [Hysterangium stoloniferum]